MHQFIEALSKESLLTFVGLILGIVGIILAIIFYVKSKREKIPRYASRTFNLLDDHTTSLPGLSVRFAGKKLARLSATKLAFWNAGSDTISRDDVAPADPISIKLPTGDKFLSARVAVQTLQGNNVGILVENENTCTLTFDYLDKEQGTVVFLLHTGTSDTLTMQGSVKRARALSTIRMTPRKWLRWVMYFVVFVFSMFMAAVFRENVVLFFVTVFVIALIVALADDAFIDAQKVPRSLRVFYDPFSKDEFS